MHKYIVGKNQKHLVVSEQVHELVKMYSKDKGLSMIEVTYELLRIAFTTVYDLNTLTNQR